MALTDEQRKAHLQALKANPMLTETLEDMRGSAMARWRGSQPEDVGAREDAWKECGVLDKFERKIDNTLTKLIKPGTE